LFANGKIKKFKKILEKSNKEIIALKIQEKHIKSLRKS